jgi:hypothetical protein
MLILYPDYRVDKYEAFGRKETDCPGFNHVSDKFTATW